MNLLLLNTPATGGKLEQALEKLAPGIIQESKTAWQKDGDLLEFLKDLQVKYK